MNLNVDITVFHFRPDINPGDEFDAGGDAWNDMGDVVEIGCRRHIEFNAGAGFAVGFAAAVATAGDGRVGHAGNCPGGVGSAFLAIEGGDFFLWLESRLGTELPEAIDADFAAGGGVLLPGLGAVPFGVGAGRQGRRGGDEAVGDKNGQEGQTKALAHDFLLVAIVLDFVKGRCEALATPGMFV